MLKRSTYCNCKWEEWKVELGSRGGGGGGGGEWTRVDEGRGEVTEVAAWYNTA